MSRRLRVGIVDYLNSRPLAWSFLHGPPDRRFAPEFTPPAEVADRLAGGAIDIGLIPSIEYQRIPGLALVPGLCVASQREVRSVLLVARKPLERARRVALDRNSRTSAALVHILLAERYGVEPVFTPADPDLEEMLSANDAALVIGDPALHIDRSAYRVHDLAREWRQLTGLPFVFAVWAVGGRAARGELAGELAGWFCRSLEAGLANLDTLAEEAAAELGLDSAEVRAYLGRNLSYRLGAREIRALGLFYDKAARYGLVPAARPLSFLEESG